MSSYIATFHALIVEYVVVDAVESLDGGPPLKMAAKCYTDGRNSIEGLTLLLAHGCGSHKEVWEPMLEQVFQEQSKNNPDNRIREAWAFDSQSHGDSAILNATVLQATPSGTSVSEWAHGLVSFVNSRYAVGHRFVLIGHSMGASACMYSTKFFPFRLPYSAVILVEPLLIDRSTHMQCQGERERYYQVAERIASTRRDSWAHKADALEYFSGLSPWKSWDTRVLKLYVEHGLRAQPAANGQPAQAVLKGRGSYEGAAYADLDVTFDATEQITRVCNNVPISIIFGQINDTIPRYIQDALIDGPKGRKLGSTTRIPGAGHMVPMQQPEALALSICRILNTVGMNSTRL